jgi:basic membrane protein A and related proteins
MHRHLPIRCAVVHIAVLLLCACSTTDRGTTDSTSASASFKVALLTPGPISDQSWNGGAYAGLLRIRDSLGATISHIQTKSPAEFEENFRQYGAQGYQLVIGHGFEFQDAAVRVAPEHPRTVYLTTSGNTVRDNVAGINFAFEDASYLAGLVAAAVTKSGIVGAIGGTELPPVKRSFEAFAQGVRAADPSARVITSYVGNWDDASAGKEQALAQFARGVDVIFQNADAAGLGIFQAAREHDARFIIGSNANQNGIAPEVTLGSVVIDLPLALMIVAREVKDGRFRPRVVSLGLHENVVRLELNEALSSRIPPSTRVAVDSLRRMMLAGTFTVPIAPASAP